jgi:hypothetical protein
MPGLQRQHRHHRALPGAAQIQPPLVVDHLDRAQQTKRQHSAHVS